jgi:type I restriction enzyme S subunit
MMAVVPRGGDPRYWLYLLSLIDLGELSPSGPLPCVSEAQVRDIRVSLPPFEEQRRIADFLGLQCAKIDAIIEARRQLLKLLEERENSRIFAAVGGMDEPGERKCSGLRWLGDVPREWPVLSVSSQFEVLLGKMLNQERARGDHLRPYLRNTNVQWDQINTDDLLEMDFPPHERSRYGVQVGDLLICEGGQPGRSAIWDGRVEEIYYQKALHRARSRGRSSVRWLFYCLRAATALDVFTVEGNTTTIGHLTGEQLRAHRFPFPNRRIQDRLVDRLDATGTAARRAQAVIRKQIELLTERREALIAAAVTGHLDVTTARRADV